MINNTGQFTFHKRQNILILTSILVFFYITVKISNNENNTKSNIKLRLYIHS